MTDKKNWIYGGVSVTGFSHEEKNIPCQDAHALTCNKNNMFVGAVCDGAGSARLSHFGSKVFAEAVVDALINYSEDRIFPEEAYIRSVIISAISSAQEKLLLEYPEVELTTGENKSRRPSTIRDFHSTLVAAIANERGGAFIHVGDGVGTAFSSNNLKASVVSKPENGEYVNQTYFVTEGNWEERLRIKPFYQYCDTILLMSDGVQGMAMSKGHNHPFEKFVSPLLSFIRDNEREKNEVAVRNTLSKEIVRRSTPDDKTLVWAMR
tara:strand:+ start:737 stop:1531 length:795 start_codon:yes stop_codon:yes gene_type:complete